jgi:ubiquinone/menaquinone biosynthesis C-methylase UbiE
MEKGFLKMSELSNQHYLLTNQYNNAQKLEARIQLHRLFSTNRYSWFRWVFDHFALPPQSSLLELGCGPGYVWSRNADRIPEQWQITLSDFSPGMLQEARQNLQAMHRPFMFKQVDAQAIPFGNESFDAVIANHMLYHVPDGAKALAEIHRVLKPGGVFYAATNGRDNMHKLRGITTSLVPSATAMWGEISQDQTQPYSFYLETGGAELAPWFSPVTIHHYEDALVVTEVQPLIAYILSTPIATLFSDELIQHAIDIVQSEIDEKGAIHIRKVSGLFEARVVS